MFNFFILSNTYLIIYFLIESSFKSILLLSKSILSNIYYAKDLDYSNSLIFYFAMLLTASIIELFLVFLPNIFYKFFIVLSKISFYY